MGLFRGHSVHIAVGSATCTVRLPTGGLTCLRELERGWIVHGLVFESLHEVTEFLDTTELGESSQLALDISDLRVLLRLS